MFQWQHVHGAEQHQHNINNIEKQWMGGVPQMSAAPGGSPMFGGAPHTSYQGHFLVPVKQEVCQLPINQIRVQFMQFINLGPVNFDTLVFHTGTGEIHKLGFYFNEHIVSLVVLNAMFNNSSSGDRAQFDQAPELRLFNMQQSQTQGTLGRLNQALHLASDQVCRQQEMDHQHQAWRMEAAHAHLRTLDWVLHQDPYDGSDAQESVDREEEMIRMREVEAEQDVDMEVSEEEVDCAFTIENTLQPASFDVSKVDETQVQPPLSPRRTRSGAILAPRSRDEAMSEEGPSFSPRRTRNGAFY